MTLCLPTFINEDLAEQRESRPGFSTAVRSLFGIFSWSPAWHPPGGDGEPGACGVAEGAALGLVRCCYPAKVLCAFRAEGAACLLSTRPHTLRGGALAGDRNSEDPCVGCWGFRGLWPSPVLKVLSVLCAWVKGRDEKPATPGSRVQPPSSAPTQTCPRGCPPTLHLPAVPGKLRAINVPPSNRPDTQRLFSPFLLLPIPKLLAPLWRRQNLHTRRSLRGQGLHPPTQKALLPRGNYLNAAASTLGWREC